MNLTSDEIDILLEAASDCRDRFWRDAGSVEQQPHLFVSRDVMEKTHATPVLLRMKCVLDAKLKGMSMYCESGYGEPA